MRKNPKFVDLKTNEIFFLSATIQAIKDENLHGSVGFLRTHNGKQSDKENVMKAIDNMEGYQTFLDYFKTLQNKWLIVTVLQEFFRQLNPTVFGRKATTKLKNMERHGSGKYFS